jgi:hypothetical protein
MPGAKITAVRETLLKIYAILGESACTKILN